MSTSIAHLGLSVSLCCGLLVAGCSGRQADTETAQAAPTSSTAESADAQASDVLRVLIIDGVNNHDWQSTTAANKATLESTGRFTVEVSTSPSKRASREEWEAWRPSFADYDVVLSNFNDDCGQEGGCDSLWSEVTKADLEAFVRGGGGFVAVHAADNHDANWLEYNKMIGVGGWGGRQAGVHGSILRMIDGEWTATSPDEGLSGEHGRQREFTVIHDQPDHPILAGLPSEWMHAQDELYSSLRGPAENVEVLAHSYSLYTEENEPILMLIPYGEGKIFHIPLGHFNDESEPAGASVYCLGFQTVLARGTEYVATGEVTLGVPDSFPGTDEAVVIAPADVIWAAAAVAGGQSPGRPELTEVWDPVPPKIDPADGGRAPSDAIVLFDGTDLSEWTGRDGAARWNVEDGALTVVKETGEIATRRAFGDVQLHIEWRSPAEVVGEGQGRGNSGVFLMGLYEVQVLDSYENRTYSNGQAGSVYKQFIPEVNATRAPGEWQSYDIVFMAPRFAADGSVEEPATMTVLHNGVLIHNHVTLRGPTRFIGEPAYEAHESRLPLTLQDHGNPVSFRNIWVRELQR